MSNTVGGVGGGNSEQLQRALINAAEKQVDTEAAMLERLGKNTTDGTKATSTNTAPVDDTVSQPPTDEAITVRLTDPETAPQAGQLTTDGKWLTTAKTPAGQPPTVLAEAEQLIKDLPQLPTASKTVTTTPTTDPTPNQALGSTHVPGEKNAPAGPATTGTVAPGTQPTAAEKAPTTQVPTQTAAQSALGSPLSFDDDQTVQLLTMLKSQGIPFKEAAAVLRQMQPDRKLPSNDILKALWNTADAETPIEELPIANQPLDDLIRDKSWTPATAPALIADLPEEAAQTPRPLGRELLDRVGPEPETTPANVPAQAATPQPAGTAQHAAAQAAFARAAHADVQSQVTLQSVVVNQAATQIYVAGLSTSEFSNLVAMVGATAPAWWWQVRSKRGLRRLFEGRTFASLNTSRIAGVRPLFWILGIIGAAIFWFVGAESGIWW